MSIFDFFKTDLTGQRRSHIKNLISIAMADGYFDTDEWNLLISIAQKLDMPESDIEEIRNNKVKVKFVVPPKYQDKLQQVNDLVAMMTIDGEINRKELQLCKKIALNLNIHPRAVDEIAGEMHQIRVA